MTASFDSATRRLLGAGWLKGARFDSVLVVAMPALAIAGGTLAALDRRFLLPVLLTALALIDPPRVDVRGAKDDAAPIGASARAVFAPLLLWTGFAALAFGVAAWLPATLYFYWQWFHGTRRSWSVLEAYRRRSDRVADLGDPALLTAAFYMVPAWGILRRCAQAPQSLIGLDIHLMPVPPPMVQVIGIAACGAVALWLVERILASREGRLPLAHTLYAMSHFAVFAVAYGVIEDVTAGWLVAHIWRSGQDLCLARLRSRRESSDRVMPLHARRLDAKWVVLGFVVAIGSAAALLVRGADLAAALAVVAILFLAADAWGVIANAARGRAPGKRLKAPPERSSTWLDTRLAEPGGNVLKITTERRATGDVLRPD